MGIELATGVSQVHIRFYPRSDHFDTSCSGDALPGSMNEMKHGHIIHSYWANYMLEFVDCATKEQQDKINALKDLSENLR